MASTVWKGYISFGLVSVPIRLYAAARESHVSFNQIHTPCGSRIKQQIVCPTCDRPVERNEIAKGFAVEKDVYVLVSAEELRELESESSGVMEIQQFVSLADVDPIFYETSYYSAAEEPGRRAYALLFTSMKKLNVAAVAKVALHGREQVVLIRPYWDGMVLHTLYFAEEVREISEYGREGNIALQDQEIALAETFMRQLTAPFQPEQYHDTYRDKVMSLIETKQAGLAATAPQPQRRLAPVVDLMEALKKSLEAKGAAVAASPTPIAAASAPVAAQAASKDKLTVVPKKPPVSEVEAEPAAAKESKPKRTGSGRRTSA